MPIPACMPALAPTPAEETMFSAPMPHRLRGGHGAAFAPYLAHCHQVRVTGVRR